MNSSPSDLPLPPPVFAIATPVPMIAYSSAQMQEICEYAAQVTDERDALRAFAKAVMQSWPHGDVDGGELQDAAVSAGLLAGWYVIESCGEGCGCEDFPTTCYRPTPLLTGEKT